jgi:hypothetical protein
MALIAELIRYASAAFICKDFELCELKDFDGDRGAEA